MHSSGVSGWIMRLGRNTSGSDMPSHPNIPCRCSIVWVMTGGRCLSEFLIIWPRCISTQTHPPTRKTTRVHRTVYNVLAFCQKFVKVLSYGLMRKLYRILAKNIMANTIESYKFEWWEFTDNSGKWAFGSQ